MRSALVVLIVVLAACSSPRAPDEPDARDDQAMVDAPGADAPDTSGTPPPACIALTDEPASCRECLGGPPLAAADSVCAQTVCARDPSCCQTVWDQRCVQLADAHCEIDECVNTVAFTGGTASLVVAQWDGATVSSDDWTHFPDQLIPGADWADYDGDGLADAVFASECFVKVLRGRGWNGDQLAVVPVFTEDLGCGTATVSYGSWARWVDVDQDGDLDVVASGSRGGFWVEQQAGELSRAGDLLPPGSAGISAFTVSDLDGDRHLDVIASVWRPVPGTDDSAETLERFEYDPIDGFVPRPGWGTSVYYRGIETMRWCNLAGDADRELVFAGWMQSFGHNVIDGVLGDTVFALAGRATVVTCGNLDDDPFDEVIIGIEEDGQPADLAIIDGTEIVWRSSVDLPAPLLVTAGALEAVDLDDDGDLDLVVGGVDLPDAPGVVTVLRRQAGAGLSFTAETVGDLLAGHDMHAAQVLHLPRRPAPAR